MAWAFKFAFPIANWDPSATTHTTRSETAGSSVSAGDTIVVAVPYRISGDTTVTVADDLGNTYTEDTTARYYLAGDAFNAVRFFYSNITTGGTPTITATAASAASFFGVFACAYSGLSATPFQVAAAYKRTAGVGSSTDALASNSATVSTPPVLVFGFAYTLGPSSGSRISAGTGFTSRITGQAAGLDRDYVKIEDRRVTASGATTATFTESVAGVDAVACVLCFSEAITAPTIQGGTANPVHNSTGNTVTGVNFGSNTGSAALTIGGQAQTVTGWTSTTVTYTANRGVNLDDVAVNAVLTDSTGLDSDPYALTGFDPPAGYQYVTLASVNATAAYRITAAGDLAIGNQLEWDNSLVTINDDGSFVADPSVSSFYVRVGVTTDGWGALALQSINGSSSVSGFSGVPVRRAFNKRSGLGF